jgi:flavin reductase (DIM6/NTAB) family NADH-FMN oxidoreductase RutF
LRTSDKYKTTTNNNGRQQSSFAIQKLLPASNSPLQTSFLHTTSRRGKSRPNFAEVQASRPHFETDRPLNYTKPPKPQWKRGDGANDGGASLQKEHVEIDPYAEGRSPGNNYKLLISGIIPRPIAFISTKSKDGKSTNLAPFSYSQLINHDPPLFAVGFLGSLEKAKDTLKNLTETGECVINIISEHFVEAANEASIDVPYGVSEWEISGLHEAPCSTVKASRVKESVFSIEGKLVETKEFESRAKAGKKTGVLAIIEGTRFWVREDAINEERNKVSLDVLRPISRLGGMAYGRTTDVIEILRPSA